MTTSNNTASLHREPNSAGIETAPPTTRKHWLLLVSAGVALAVAALVIAVPKAGIACLALVLCSVLGLIATAFLAAVFWVLRICRLIRRAAPRKPLWICLAMLSVGLFGLIVTNAWMMPALPPAPGTVSEQLAYMLRTDQEDRFAVRVAMNLRDEQRLNRVLELHEHAQIVSPQDCFAAGLILQHGSEPEHYRLAHEFAKTAHDHGIEDAAWLEHATYDRWQMSIGKPQLYGTQTKFELHADGGVTR